MIKQTVLDRFTKNQRKQISMSLPCGEVTKDLQCALNTLDEILTEYETHDWCDHPSYRRYYRIFNITARALYRITKVLSRSGGPKFV